MKKTKRKWLVEVTGKDLWQLDQAALKALNLIDFSDYPKNVCELGIQLVSDRKIKILNRDYRGKNKATDVLSFSQLEGLTTFKLPRISLGDVVISYETAKKQAKKFKVSLKEEIYRLLTHGILHLAGYDHENVSASAAKNMYRLQDEILSKLLK